MRNYGRIAGFIMALALCIAKPVNVMAQVAAGGVNTGDELPIIALVLCVAGVAIIILALRKRK
ncbi:MAG: hypothetical protein LIO37_03115 [Clostridiales bacterium]|nr:hypothetical protein [Clostridiales bacterium]